MEITITGRHHQLGEPVKTYLHERLAKVSKLYDRITAMNVIIDQVHGDTVVELLALAPRGQRFSAKEEGSDLRRTIDQAEQKLTAQIRQWKERLSDHRGT